MNRSARLERAWEVLGTVPDPEVPVLSVRDLGIVRDVVDHGEALEVVLTPTYSGCPATEAIEHEVLAAIESAGLGPAWATLRRAPAWTTDWITDEGRRKLVEFGIAPPDKRCGPASASERVELVRCPLCGSADTRLQSRFGSTACKSLRVCNRCREPFDHFKAL